MTECNLCGFKIHIKKGLDTSVIIIKNEINSPVDKPSNFENYTFKKKEKICSKCVFTLFKSLKKQKEHEILVNTSLYKILESKTTSKIDYKPIINSLENEFNTLDEVNKNLEKEIEHLKKIYNEIQYKIKLHKEYHNYFWKITNDIEYLTNRHSN